MECATSCTEIPSNPADGMEAKEAVTIHFVADGFTALGRSWYQGMELTLELESPGWHATFDSEGNTWLNLTEAEQHRRYGKVFFRPGPWPGDPWPEEQRSYLPEGLLNCGFLGGGKIFEGDSLDADESGQSRTNADMCEAPTHDRITVDTRLGSPWVNPN